MSLVLHQWWLLEILNAPRFWELQPVLHLITRILRVFSAFDVEQMVNGEPVLEAAVRTPIGGYHVTDYLKRLLSLQYPFHVYVLHT